jgi:hypothetical protein
MNPEITKFLLGCLGCFLIWIAVEYKRTPECKYSLFSNEGLVQFLLITIGVTIIQNI